MECKISVVVPVYNVEKFLDRCIESILAQTFSDFELLLVDDGSPDRCPQMCDDWAKKDRRIAVIHKENGGLADARNCGIRAAAGEYVAFVDSDDWVEPLFLETLYKGMIEHDADVVQCNYQRVSEGKPILFTFETQFLDEAYIKNTLLLGMANARLTVMSNSRWNKLYKTSLVKKAIGLCDVSISMGEDYLMNFAVFGLCKKIVVLNTAPLYNYCYNVNSISSLYHKEYKYREVKFYANLKEIAQAYGCYGNNIDFLLNQKYANYIFQCAICDWSRADKKKEIREIIGMLDRKLWRSSIKYCDVPAERVCMWMSYFGMTDLMLILVDLRKKTLQN